MTHSIAFTRPLLLLLLVGAPALGQGGVTFGGGGGGGGGGGAGNPTLPPLLNDAFSHTGAELAQAHAVVSGRVVEVLNRGEVSRKEQRGSRDGRIETWVRATFQYTITFEVTHVVRGKLGKKTLKAGFLVERDADRAAPKPSPQPQSYYWLAGGAGALPSAGAQGVLLLRRARGRWSARCLVAGTASALRTQLAKGSAVPTVEAWLLARARFFDASCQVASTTKLLVACRKRSGRARKIAKRALKAEAKVAAALTDLRDLKLTQESLRPYAEARTAMATALGAELRRLRLTPKPSKPKAVRASSKKPVK